MKPINKILIILGASIFVPFSLPVRGSEYNSVNDQINTSVEYQTQELNQNYSIR